MRSFPLGFAALLLSGACAPQAQNERSPSSETDRSDIQNACEPSRVMMVLDRSSSMQTGRIGNQTKWSIASQAIDEVSAEFEQTLKMGLTTFPAEGQCSAGETLVAPAFGNRDLIIENLAEPPPEAGNWTPMAQTLAATMADPSMQLNGTAEGRYALLITDGWQWCSPYDASTRFDAVDRVQELKEKGITTFVVGFGDSVDARALNLMAVAAGTDQAGCDSNGSAPNAANPCYYQADSPEELKSALQQIVVSITGEVCDGFDNDCDGEVDENLVQSCSTDCGSGSETCSNGQWNGCDAPPVEAEVCDNQDNDCDGITDNGCECVPGEEQVCGNSLNQGVCQPGQQTCDSNGQWGDCTGEIAPSPEQCDSLDNDCDGTADNVNADEICDGVDNDCDGDVDEGLVRTCATDCGNGSETCTLGQWLGCDAPPVEEDVCDGIDNDCNGLADDDCECLPGETIVCGDSNLGECSTGVQTCDANGNWGACEGDEGPSTEFCDGKDNDCDGVTDESNGTDDANNTDDVSVICPPGDEADTDEDEDNDPALDNGGVASGCSSSGQGGAGAGFILMALGMFLIRRKEGLA